MALFLIFEEGGEGGVWVIMFWGGRGLLPNASYKKILTVESESHRLYSIDLPHLSESSFYL
jgi:hypothetical protein